MILGADSISVKWLKEYDTIQERKNSGVMSGFSRDRVFSLHDILQRDDAAFRLLAPLAESLLGLTKLSAFYRHLPSDVDVEEFIEAALDGLRVSLEVASADLERIPKEGPAIVVANHPYGGIEGLALALLLRRLRPDVKVMANFLLGRIPELRELFILVNPFDSRGAARLNFSALRQTIRWVRDGHIFAVFPAGEVASLDLKRQQVIDPPWDPTIARIIRRSNCPVIPLHFDGHNSQLFQYLGLLHPSLRTMLLPRQMINQRPKKLITRIGNTISPRTLAQWPTDTELINYLRMRTEVLAERPLKDGETEQAFIIEPKVQKVIEPVPPDLLEAEIEQLGPESCLVDSTKNQVFAAKAEHIPNVMREIGRLRELTFRGVGEGTGKDIDLDDFDSKYTHLFTWNVREREIVGAYRLGHTDTLIAEGGIDSLYTSTLFRFDPHLFEQMGPSIEMGRSFIVEKYQRSLTGLLMLWKGIGAYISRNPEYPLLFGPVSISADYVPSSQKLMADFLSRDDYGHPWAHWVKARTAFDPGRRRNFLPNAAHLRSIAEVSEFISEIEHDGKGVPILLKQYLKLGGRMLGFNVDPKFSNVLDLLILVDLRNTEITTLNKYMGREQASAFLDHHGQT